MTFDEILAELPDTITRHPEFTRQFPARVAVVAEYPSVKEFLQVVVKKAEKAENEEAAYVLCAHWRNHLFGQVSPETSGHGKWKEYQQAAEDFDGLGHWLLFNNPRELEVDFKLYVENSD